MPGNTGPTLPAQVRRALSRAGYRGFDRRRWVPGYIVTGGPGTSEYCYVSHRSRLGSSSAEERREREEWCAEYKEVLESAGFQVWHTDNSIRVSERER